MQWTPDELDFITRYSDEINKIGSSKDLWRILLRVNQELGSFSYNRFALILTNLLEGPGAFTKRVAVSTSDPDKYTLSFYINDPGIFLVIVSMLGNPREGVVNRTLAGFLELDLHLDKTWLKDLIEKVPLTRV